MKFMRLPLVLSVLALSGCSTPEIIPPPYKTDYSALPKEWVNSSLNKDEPPPAPASTPAPTPVEVPPTRAPVIADVPYGTPVPGKVGLVVSPYSTQGYVDVKGMPPGTEAKCPYTGKTFLVP